MLADAINAPVPERAQSGVEAEPMRVCGFVTSQKVASPFPTASCTDYDGPVGGSPTSIACRPSIVGPNGNVERPSTVGAHIGTNSSRLLGSPADASRRRDPRTTRTRAEGRHRHARFRFTACVVLGSRRPAPESRRADEPKSDTGREVVRSQRSEALGAANAIVRSRLSESGASRRSTPR
jgi:hypothetical protein